jgi:hypothetical protein
MAALALLITAAASCGGGVVAQEASHSADAPKVKTKRVWRRTFIRISFILKNKKFDSNANA